MENKFDMGNIDIAWCPGCGDFSILEALKTAMSELELDPKKTVLVSGIGQAAKTPQYVKSNFFNGLHGRSLPPATGIALANPELTVIVTSGDGDMYGEGGNHFIHAIRRNINITVFVYNNQIYGLTKGQASPTSMKGMKTPVQVNGVFLEPFNSLGTAIANDASFVARTRINNIDETKEIMKKAIMHKGFSLVEIFQPCVSFNKLNTYDWYKENTFYLDAENHDVHSRNAAFELTTASGKLPLGVFYISKDKLTLGEFDYDHLDDRRPLFRHNLDKVKLAKLIESKKEKKESSKDKSDPNNTTGTKESSGYILKIAETWDETHNVKSFVLYTPPGFKFTAGQHIMVSFGDGREVNGKTQIPLSISNPPTDHNKIMITFKNMGGFTAELSKLTLGNELVISEPFGETFNIDERCRDNIVFLAGGTGVTPFMSSIRYLLAAEKSNKVFLFNGNLTEKDIIFKSELELICSEQSHIEVINVLSEKAGDCWNKEEGFITEETIKKYLKDEDLNNFVWIMCGPPPMINAMKTVLKSLGVKDTNIKFEEWDAVKTCPPGEEEHAKEASKSESKDSATCVPSEVKEAVQAASASKEEPQTTPEVKTNTEPEVKMEEKEEAGPKPETKEAEPVVSSEPSGKAILLLGDDKAELEAGAKIMDSAEQLGVPFGCRAGVCGTCKITIEEGMENLEPLTDKEKKMNLDSNQRLACQTVIKGGTVKIKL